MHALIVGERGVGKSTLIQRVLKACKRPVYGFETKKEEALADELGIPVYIYEALHERRQTKENLIGYCNNKCFDATAETFERFSPKLRKHIPSDSIILMDELGFMETQAKEFCSAVSTLLDGDIPIIAAVKDRPIPFLEKIRAHPNAKCFYITPNNRDELYQQVLEFMYQQINASNEKSVN